MKRKLLNKRQRSGFRCAYRRCYPLDWMWLRLMFGSAAMANHIWNRRRRRLSLRRQ
jgi:hypothetical protein